MKTSVTSLKKSLVLLVLLSFGPFLNGCDFVNSIIEMFSSGAGGAAAEATQESIGGEAGKQIGSAAGEMVSTTVKTKATDYVNRKQAESEQGVAEDTSTSIDGDG